MRVHHTGGFLRAWPGDIPLCHVLGALQPAWLRGCGLGLVDALAAVGDDQGNERAGPGDHSEGKIHQVEECLRVELRSGVDLLEAQQVHQPIEDPAIDQDRSSEGDE
ncbi:hypothetical protein [Streptomyces sparsogenes]|uniref:hypothetical protein n=1 Tax=Streptomyces sparsogenes TaxID=67365 RepID=UPI003F4D5489